MTDQECAAVLQEHFSWVDPLRTHEVSYEKLKAAIERAIVLLEREAPSFTITEGLSTGPPGHPGPRLYPTTNAPRSTSAPRITDG